jgi:hypothetical protein
VYVVVPDSTGAVDLNTVRGSATGGNTLVVGNAELRVPSPLLKTRLRLAAFVDAGSVWERGGGTGSGPQLRVTPGVGLRFLTPLGPARFDVAYNGYDLQSGRLYLIHKTGNLELLQASYQPPKRPHPWVLQLGIGQAF